MANEVEEFTKSHTNGWGRIPLQKKEGIRTFKVLGFGPIADAANTQAEVEVITQRKTTRVNKYTVEYLQKNATWFIPESKFINTDNFVVRCVAYPKRQYSKVLTNDNVYFSAAIQTKPPNDILPLLKQGILDIMDGFAESYPSYADAYESINQGRAYAKAFGKRFLVALDARVRYPVIVYKDAQIGYDRGDVLICIKKVEKMQEIIQSITGKRIEFQ